MRQFAVNKVSSKSVWWYANEHSTAAVQQWITDTSSPWSRRGTMTRRAHRASLVRALLLDVQGRRRICPPRRI